MPTFSGFPWKTVHLFRKGPTLMLHDEIISVVTFLNEEAPTIKTEGK